MHFWMFCRGSMILILWVNPRPRTFTNRTSRPGPRGAPAPALGSRPTRPGVDLLLPLLVMLLPPRLLVQEEELEQR